MYLSELSVFHDLQNKPICLTLTMEASIKDLPVAELLICLFLF